MKKFKVMAVGLLISACAITGLLSLIGILLLPAQLASPERAAHENISGIGYTEEIPSSTLLFVFPDTSGLLIHFDFSSLCTNYYVFGQEAEEKAAELPYQIDYNFFPEEDFLPRLADRLGGVEIEDENGEKKLYFSAAVQEFCEKELTDENRIILVDSFFDKIAKMGLSSEDFMFIIEVGKGNISYSVCYDWISHIKTMFSNTVLG